MNLPDFSEHENAGRILEEGWKLFQQKGYRGVTIDELCERCALTKPTLYYYFQDKENLFVQILTHKLRGFHGVVEQPGTLAERLTWVAASIFESFQNEYNLLLRDREHIKRPENRLKIRDAFHSELFGPLNALMNTGIEQSELQADRPETLTLIYLGIVNNFIGKAVELKLDQTELARTLTTYFLHGAQKR